MIIVMMLPFRREVGFKFLDAETGIAVMRVTPRTRVERFVSQWCRHAQVAVLIGRTVRCQVALLAVLLALKFKGLDVGVVPLRKQMFPAPAIA